MGYSVLDSWLFFYTRWLTEVYRYKMVEWCFSVLYGWLMVDLKTNSITSGSSGPLTLTQLATFQDTPQIMNMKHGDLCELQTGFDVYLITENIFHWGFVCFRALN